MQRLVLSLLELVVSNWFVIVGLVVTSVVVVVAPMTRRCIVCSCKVQGFLRRSVSVGFCSPDLSSFNELCTQAEENMFSKVLNNTDHVTTYSRLSIIPRTVTHLDRVHMIENYQIVLRI